MNKLKNVIIVALISVIIVLSGIIIHLKYQITPETGKYTNDKFKRCGFFIPVNDKDFVGFEFYNLSETKSYYVDDTGTKELLTIANLKGLQFLRKIDQYYHSLEADYVIIYDNGTILME